MNFGPLLPATAAAAAQRADHARPASAARSSAPHCRRHRPLPDPAARASPRSRTFLDYAADRRHRRRRSDGPRAATRRSRRRCTTRLTEAATTWTTRSAARASASTWPSSTPTTPGATCSASSATARPTTAARSARDRDRLRQQVLEGLGWRIHRIWSTDWFRNPEQQYAKLTQAIETARLHFDASSHTEATVRTAGPTARDVLTDMENPSRPQRDPAEWDDSHVAATSYARSTAERAPISSDDFYWLPYSQLVKVVEEVVHDEGPIHLEVVARRVAGAYGLQRMGARMAETLDSAIDKAVRGHDVVRRGDFLWPVGMESAPLRDRSMLDSAERRIQHVPPEEISLAVLTCVEASCGITETDTLVEAARLLGFGRTGRDIKAAIETVLEVLVDDGTLERSAGYLIARRYRPT